MSSIRKPVHRPDQVLTRLERLSGTNAMKINYSVHISGNPDRVFSWIANPEKAMMWQRGVKSGAIINETPEKVGTTFIEVMEEGGKSLEMRGVITGYVRNEMISFHLDSRLHSVDVCYSIRGGHGRSEISLESDIHWKFPMNIMSLFIGRKIRENIIKQIKSEFAELDRLREIEKVSPSPDNEERTIL